MSNILLGVTGSVAALKTPELFRALTDAGHSVRIVSTDAARYFFDEKEIPRDSIFLDSDEWPGRATGNQYKRDDPVLHIELRRWADLLLIAPLDANTLAKIAFGICDNCLTCIWRAWDRERPVLLAPAMNTLMWENPTTARQLQVLIDTFSPIGSPHERNPDQLVAHFNAVCPRMNIISPQEKLLACGDVGQGAMADVESIVGCVIEQTKSELSAR